MLAVAGGAQRTVGAGGEDARSQKGDRIAFLPKGDLWTIGLEDGAKPAQLIHPKGQTGELRWSPDGTRIAFVTARTDHAFIGMYNFGAKSLSYLDASTDRDSNPVWSSDGKQVAFIRIASTSTRTPGPVRSAAYPWSIRLADADSGNGRELWHASEGLGSAFHAMLSDNQLLCGAADRIVFPSKQTVWMHLYSISTHR